MIYLDLDDTLCDFSGAMAIALNKLHLHDRAKTNPVMGHYITGDMLRNEWHLFEQDCNLLYSREFFANLPLKPWAPKLLHELPAKETTILTYVPGNRQDIILGKLDWIKKHIPVDVKTIFAPRSISGKAQYKQKSTDILVDDLSVEVDLWGLGGYMIPRDFNLLLERVSEKIE